VTTHRSRQRNCARLGAIFVVLGALLSVVALEQAAAAVTTAEPAVQIGESRSVERSESAAGGDTADAVGPDDSAVAGVAVAGVAIVRDAPPVAYRLDTDIANRHPNPLALLIGLGVETVMIASLWHR
jgi:hypothetical protein